MRAIVPIVLGLCIASVAIAQDGRVQPLPPVDLSLAPPSPLTVSRVPDSDNFIYLAFQPVSDADRYHIYREFTGEEMEGLLPGELVNYASIEPPEDKDVDELNVIVYVPELTAESLWVVSAVIGDVQTLVTWGRLPPVATAVRSTSWGAVKADRP